MAAPAALALHFDVGVEFFVAMKQIMFGKYPQNTLQEYFLDQWQHTHPQPSIEIEPFVEPDHPEWFDDFQAEPLRVTLGGFNFDDVTWGPFLQDSFSTDVAKSTGQPEMYCETNSSTHLLVKFELNVINPTASTPTPAVLPDAIVIKKLALLLVAFEGEIDKLLADHAGYITHSASAISHGNNSVLHPLPMDQKLTRIWNDCATIDDVAQTMCPPLLTNQYAAHPSWHSNYKTDFHALLKPAADGPHLAFRQHHGTLRGHEMSHWILLLGNIIQLAFHISEADLLRLVHYDDTDPVLLTELFHMMLSRQPLTPAFTAMMHFYTRKSIARGTALRRESRLRLTGKDAAVRQYAWKDIQADKMRKRPTPPIP